MADKSNLPALPQETLEIGVSYLTASNEQLGLTEQQATDFKQFQQMNRILGPAGGGILMCPGNQTDLDDKDKCPYHTKCPLLRAGKAPEGFMCPIETDLVQIRFNGWCKEIEEPPTMLAESSRVFVSDLTFIDLQVNRCTSILSTREAGNLRFTNVTEAVIAEGGAVIPLTTETVIHANAELLDQLSNRRRMMLKEWMLTPEQKFKKARAEGLGRGNDLSSKQSALADKLKKLGPVIDG